MVEIAVAVYSGNDFPQDTPPVEYPDVREAEEILIVGSGPAGMFAALKAIECGYRPIVLERGKDVQCAPPGHQGTLHPTHRRSRFQYCFGGRGGAGTYSDGKLYTRSKKRGDTSGILARLVQHGASPEIITDARPHHRPPTSCLPWVENIRRQIVQCGGDYLFGRRVSELQIRHGRVCGVETLGGERFEARAVILATGHSARDIYELLHRKGIALQAKGTAVGVRLEHPQDLIDRIQYGPKGRGQYLPAAAYRVVRKAAGGAFTAFACVREATSCPVRPMPGRWW